jgi:hypothetical protein
VLAGSVPAPGPIHKSSRNPPRFWIQNPEVSGRAVNAGATLLLLIAGARIQKRSNGGRTATNEKRRWSRLTPNPLARIWAVAGGTRLGESLCLRRCARRDRSDPSGLAVACRDRSRSEGFGRNGSHPAGCSRQSGRPRTMHRRRRMTARQRLPTSARRRLRSPSCRGRFARDRSIAARELLA